MEHLRIKDIDFTSTKSRKRNLDEMHITGSSNNSVASETEPDTTANPPKESKMEAFTRSKVKLEQNLQLLSLVSKHSEAYVSSTSSKLPSSLTSNTRG